MTPGRWCIVVAGLALVAVWLWPDRSATENPQYDALVHAHQHAKRTEDSLKTVAGEAVKQSVIARRAYTEAKANIEPAFVKVLATDSLATIHLNTETVTIPREVAFYIMSLQRALALADAALAASDSALAKTQQVVAASDTVEAVSDSLVAVLQEKPSFLARAWQKVRTPAAFLAGVLAARAVR